MAGSTARVILKITNDESLSAASDALHDAFFKPDDIVYESNQKVFRVVMWREIYQLARKRRIIPFLYRIETPWIRCELEFRSVKEASVEVTDGVGLTEYCLVEIRYDRGRGILRFDVMGPLKIELTVEELYGEMRDIGNITWEGPRIATVVPSWRP